MSRGRGTPGPDYVITGLKYIIFSLKIWVLPHLFSHGDREIMILKL
jgi:hypothetical protein